MKRRIFLIPSLIAAGFFPGKADATPGVPIVKKADPQSILERLRIKHLFSLAGHRSHSSHSSHACHSSHASSSSGGYIPRSTYTSPTYSSPTYSPPTVPAVPPSVAPSPAPLYSAPVTTQPATPKSDAPAARVIATPTSPGASPSVPLKVLPGNSGKFKQIVMLVQSGLTAYGYYGVPLTGAVDEDTRAALKQMQQDNNLKVTGTITSEVLTAFGIAAQ